MKIFKRDIPENFAVVDSVDGNQYVLIKHKFSGYSQYENYSIHLFDQTTGRLNRLPVITLQCERFRLKKYAPYVFRLMPILAFALSRDILGSNMGHIRLNKDQIQAYFDLYRQAIQDGSLDGQLFIAP